VSERGVKYHFLLGGYDLEMLEIRQLLELYHEKFTDFHLSWGAKLSAYAGFFNEEEYFAGIELVEDVKPPKHFTAIDHHNINSQKPSAIEQVADILGIELNHYQRLVAANDKGYIPAMEQMGATKEEILDIRQKDRLAQGVTLIDEELAELSIKQHLSKTGELLIVESLTPRFSAITDRLFPFHSLLVTFQNQLVFYGNGKEDLIIRFHELISQGKAYYGGRDNGFFGLVNAAFSESEVVEIRNHIVELLTKSDNV
jgi:hypothetical protein